MKLSHVFTAPLIAGLSLAAFGQAGVPSAPTAGSGDAAAVAAAPQVIPAKIAIVAFQPAVAQTNEGQRDFADLRKKFEPRQTQLKALSDEIDSLKKQLQTQGDKLTDQEKAARVKTIDDKDKLLRRDAEDAQNDFQGEMNDKFQTLAQKVGQVMLEYVQKQGFTLVVDISQQQSPILWAAPSTDISRAVIDAYNAKSGVPAPAATPAAAAPAAAPRSTTPHTSAPATAPKK